MRGRDENTILVPGRIAVRTETGYDPATKDGMKAFVCLLAVACAASAHAQPSIVEIRVTGEHRMANGDTPDSSARLALADARRRAWLQAIGGLQGRADVKALQLEPAQLEAYVPVILTFDEPPARPLPAAARATIQVSLEARLDAAEAVRRINLLRKDQDATYELLRVWADAQRLHQHLADRTRTAQDQQQTVTALEVTHTAAQAYAAVARTEPVTVGGRAPSTAGRARARQLAEAARARAPESSTAHYLMGDLLIDAEEPEAAEAEYRKALDGDARSAAGRIKLGAALRYQGRFDEALAELREALRLDPGSARAHAEIGLLRRGDGNLPEAIAAYREAVRLDPDLIEAHNGLAVVLANAGMREEAVAEFREIIRIDPDSTIGFYNLAYVLADLDRDVESAAALREVIRIYPDHYNARFNLGELFRLEDKFDDAATQFREYLRLAPDTPQNQRNIRRARGYVQQFTDP